MLPGIHCNLASRLTYDMLKLKKRPNKQKNGTTRQGADLN